MSFKVRKPKRIVTFLGAGASAPFGYPTTKSFLEKLCRYTTGEEKNLLNDIRNLHWIVKDVEHVVEILDSMLYVENISKKGRLRSFFHKYPLFLDFAINKKELFTPRFKERVEWTKLVKIAHKLRDDVEELTFQEYESKVTQYAKIRREYERYFSLLKGHIAGKKKEFDVFTTNYDNVIEDYCRKSDTPCVLSVLNYEIVSPAKAKMSERLLLTKLHGSLDWLIDIETKDVQVAINQARMKDSTRWERNEYVLFGTKPRLEEAKIYNQLFSRLSQSLLKSEVCIVIGFSFRDPHINDVFNDTLSENSFLRLVVVSRSPIEDTKNLIRRTRDRKKLFKEKRIFPVRCSFGTAKAVNKINECLMAL